MTDHLQTDWVSFSWAQSADEVVLCVVLKDIKILNVQKTIFASHFHKDLSKCLIFATDAS